MKEPLAELVNKVTSSSHNRILKAQEDGLKGQYQIRPFKFKVSLPGADTELEKKEAQIFSPIIHKLSEISGPHKSADYIQKAEQEANLIKEKALRNIQTLEEEAYKKGFNRGREDGLKRAQEDIQKQIQDLQSQTAALIKSIENAKQEILKEAEAELLKLVIAVSEAVIHTSIRQDPKIIQEVIKDTAKKVFDTDDLTLHLHPADYEFISRSSDSQKILESFGGQVKLVADEGIGRGGLLIKTRHSEIDARIQSQMKEVWKKLAASSLARLSADEDAAIDDAISAIHEVREKSAPDEPTSGEANQAQPAPEISGQN